MDTNQTEVRSITRLLLKHPKDAWQSQEFVDAHWEGLHYSGRPDFAQACAEFDAFAKLLNDHVEQVHYAPFDDRAGMDSIYVRDASIITERGAILCRMGKHARESEPEAAGEVLTALGIPILGTITGDGRLEGGDVIWLDGRTIAVGRGYRTNEIGIRQLRELTRDFVDEVVAVPLPHWRGPTDVMHLMSLISPLDEDLALVYAPLLPVPFREWLIARDMTLVEVPDSEFETMGCNVLALGPRQCVVLAGNPVTRRRLEDADCEVFEYTGEEISRKGAGGPTCLTRPLVRG